MGAGYSSAIDHAEREFVNCLELVRHEAALHDERQFVQSTPSTAPNEIPDELRKFSKRYDTEASPLSVVSFQSIIGFTFPDGMEVDLSHPAVLYVLDADKDGLFSWQDVTTFIQWVDTNVPHDRFQGREFSDAVHARCVVQLWRGIGGERSLRREEAHKEREAARRRVPTVHRDPTTGFASVNGAGPSVASSSSNSEDGIEEDMEGDQYCAFDVWMLRFLRANFSPEEPDHPNTLLMPALATIHALLSIQPCLQYSLHEFCKVLDEREVERYEGADHTLKKAIKRSQQPGGTVSEDLEALKLQAVLRIPVPVVGEFLKSFIQGYVGVMRRFGLQELL